MVLIAIIVVIALMVGLALFFFIGKWKDNNKQKNSLRLSVGQLTVLNNSLQETVEKKQKLIQDQSNMLLDLQDAYKERIDSIDNDILQYKNGRKEEIDKELNNEYENKKALLENNYNELIRQCRDESTKIKDSLDETKAKAEEETQKINDAIDFQRNKFQSVIEPLQLLEKEQQDKLFYTIQIPEEYRDDIDFLLNEVSLRVNHPDILSKLVWSEYIKPNLDDTFKRIEIKAQPGIYKLTDRNSGKAYIGKSTDVKKRISDHFKSVVGNHAIADQAVHHEILRTGIWNWMIEIITYCDKDKLSELEKYYIDFFKTQEWGFNKKEGG